MRRSSVGFFLLVLSCLPASLVSAQRDAGPLELGTPVARTIKSGQVDRLSINLDEGRSVQLIVQQHGIDLVVRILSPEQYRLGDFDNASVDEGAEIVRFATLSGGVHTVEVLPYAAKPDQTGRYEIKVVEIRQALESEVRTRRNQEAARAKGIALLRSMPSLLSGIRSTEPRIQLQLKTARLLWAPDEQSARKLLMDAITGVVEFVQIQSNNDDYFMHSEKIFRLRNEVLTFAAQHDVELAMKVLQWTTPGQSKEEEQMRLELALATEVAEKHPRRAYALVENNLKRGYEGSFADVIRKMQDSDPTLAARLTAAIATRLQNEDLLTATGAASLTIELLRLARPSATTPGLLSRHEYANLFSKALASGVSASAELKATKFLQAFIAKSLLDGLKAMPEEVQTFAPGNLPTIQAKLLELFPVPDQPSPSINPAMLEVVDTGVEIITVGRKVIATPRYMEFVRKLARSGDFNRARDIAMLQTSDPYLRRMALESVDRVFAEHLIKAGNVEEGLQILRNLKDSIDRMEIITDVLDLVVSDLKKETAISFLEQARQIVTSSSRAADRDQMTTLLKIAVAYVDVDASRGIALIEPLVDQLNDMTAAAAVLNGFEGDFYEDGEFFLNESTLSDTTRELIDALSALASGDFDRVKSNVDRIRLPEIRAHAYVSVAESVINPGSLKD
ncbi:MAG TPA: hypothetical protein VFR05_04740 [Terriglobia bacterium]|nr:hypothetical protein [Terriglobia bacterium]